MHGHFERRGRKAVVVDHDRHGSERRIPRNRTLPPPYTTRSLTLAATKAFSVGRIDDLTADTSTLSRGAPATSGSSWFSHRLAGRHGYSIGNIDTGSLTVACGARPMVWRRLTPVNHELSHKLPLRFMRHLEAVVLDWAGTTIDHGSLAPVRAITELFSRHQIALSDTEARRDMGLYKKDHIRRILESSGGRREMAGCNRQTRHRGGCGNAVRRIHRIAVEGAGGSLPVDFRSRTGRWTICAKAD